MAVSFYCRFLQEFWRLNRSQNLSPSDLKIIFLKLEASSTYVLMTNKIISIILSVTFSGNLFPLVTEELIRE